jgi:hypothetical protein
LGRRASINAKKRNRRIITISIVVVIIAAVVVLALIVSATGAGSPLNGKPVSPTDMATLTGVSDNTLSTIGVPSGVTLPSAINGSSLTSGGKPEVLYIGGDYCPYCAVERWSLIIALSHFGNLSGLEYMQSSATDFNSNSPTFTFTNANYTSRYLTFVAVEEYDRAGNIIKPLTTDQQALINLYDTCPGASSGGGIPFIDIANKYAINCGAQSTLDISGQNWTQVLTQLNDPNSATAKLIDGAANTLITAFCKVDGGLPSSVCTLPYATVTLGFATPGGQTPQQSSLLVAPLMEEARWTSSQSRS